MLDFLRIEGIIQDYNSLVKFSQIQFTTDINLDSSELVPQYENERYKWYYFKGKYQRYYLNVKQKICRLSGFSTYYLAISGSVHKNRCNGQNCSDFYYSDLTKEINDLSDFFCQFAPEFKIKEIEFGVNIETCFEVYDYLCQSILVYQGEQFNRYNGKPHIGFAIELEKNYKVKIYDKCAQYHLTTNLMRFEVHIDNMHNLHKVGIYKLNDLLILENLLKLKKILISKFDKILFYETPLNTLNKRDNEYFLKVSNPKYWQMLRTEKNNINYQNQVKKYELFKRKYCTNTKGILREKIDQKFLELMSQ
ncbi:MAG: hypothetical protein ACK5UE_13100 [Chitinophagales bacterium]|jgi:hypothetical protein